MQHPPCARGNDVRDIQLRCAAGSERGHNRKTIYGEESPSSKHAPEIDARGVPVPSISVGRVQVLHTIMTSSHKVVIRDLANHHQSMNNGFPEIPGTGERTMTPAMELKKTEYADRYDVKLLLLLSRFQGSMQMPTIAAM